MTILIFLLDINGPNILVDKNGVCKLTDFGSAIKVFRNSNSAKDIQISGTANWMAPEVIRQEGYGLSADIWSFGCTVLEMLTGKLPWSQFNNPVITKPIFDYFSIFTESIPLCLM